jgi:hypothetical protein
VGVPVVFRVAPAAILADRRARVIRTIKPIVAGLAKATERAESERGVVALVRVDVVSDRRRHDMTALKAKPT